MIESGEEAALPAGLERARRAAAANVEAAGRIARFIEGISGPDPAAVAEYANLMARAQAAWNELTAAMGAAGLFVPSLESDAG